MPAEEKRESGKCGQGQSGTLREARLRFEAIEPRRQVLAPSAKLQPTIGSGIGPKRPELPSPDCRKSNQVRSGPIMADAGHLIILILKQAFGWSEPMLPSKSKPKEGCVSTPHQVVDCHCPATLSCYKSSNGSLPAQERLIRLSDNLRLHACGNKCNVYLEFYTNS